MNPSNFLAFIPVISFDTTLIMSSKKYYLKKSLQTGEFISIAYRGKMKLFLIVIVILEAEIKVH